MRYFTDFASNPLTQIYNTGATLTQVATPAVYGGGSLRVSGTSLNYSGDYAAVPDVTVDGTSATDWEVLQLLQTANVSNSLLFSMYGTAGHAVKMYVTSGGSNLRFMGGGEVWENPLPFTLSANVWFWLRVRKRGNIYAGSAWLHGSAEPATEIGQTPPIGGGSFPAYTAQQFAFEAQGSGNMYINYMSVGTQGDIAFRPYKTLNALARHSGAWKAPDPVYVKHGGIWKPADVHVRNAGIWKKVHGL